MSGKKLPFYNRDISWLSFNDRVLQEAEDASVPLLERLRFLGINSNNRDEFFRVRVATIRRLANFGKKGEKMLGTNPEKLLKSIQRIVLSQQVRFEKAYSLVLQELEKEGIHIINEQSLNKAQGAFVRKYFKEYVQPFLVPIMISSAPKFPYLKDRSIYLAVKFASRKKAEKASYAIVEIPTEFVSRFVVLPAEGKSRKVILLDDVIRFCLDEVFPIFKFDTAKAYTIKITRDAELDFDSDLSKSWLEKVEKSVKQRKRGTPVRFVYDQFMPNDLLRFILRKMKLQRFEYVTPGGRYHNFKDFINFPDLGRPQLKYRSLPPVEHPDFSGRKSLLEVIRKKDVLLMYPYHSFTHIIDLIREASIDSRVQSIYITLYRAAVNSSMINALINALRNGKSVTAVVELQARFDEETNIAHANRLQEEGAKVIFGVPGLKVHSKLFLINRKEDNKIVSYAHVGTGNFNEVSAKSYTDHALLTCDSRITREVERMFDFYKDNYKTGHYKYLVVSPFNTRKRFLKLIDHEIENVRQGKPAWMILKMNSLHDREMVEKLYQAGKTGVKIWLIIRGICSLVSEVSDMNDNIRVISIVDRFLEHSRIFIFCNGGDESYFLSSGDWMYRNLDHRSEVCVPVFDAELQRQLVKYLELQLGDNVKARIIDREQSNRYFHTAPGKRHRSQLEIYNWLSSLSKQHAAVDK